MDWLAAFFAKVIAKLIEYFTGKVKEDARDAQTINEEGARAEEAANDAVSELQEPDPPKNPINQNQEVPSVGKWSAFFKHRRNRKRP